MQRPAVQRLSLLAVVLFATALRVYQLKDVPAGFFCDEAGLGYNAFTIATAGQDESGTTLPLFFWSFGVSLKNPAFVYAAAIPVKILGLSEFSVRLTSALFGVGTVIGMFFLGRALLNPWVGLFAAVFLAVCPWHLHFSRIAFELISFPFFFVIAVTLLVRYTQGRRTLPAAMFFFAMCIYAYQIANLFVPMFLLGFVVLYLPALFRRWRETLVATVVALATVAPAAWFHYSHQNLSTQYFRNTTWMRPTEPWRPQLDQFVHFYSLFFSRAFLFEIGDPNVVRHSVRGFGELLPFYLPFLVLGAAVAALRRDRATKLVLWWLALYPIGPSLMTEIPTASRSIIGAPALCLLTAIGFAAALRFPGWLLGRWRPLALAVQAAGLAAAVYFLAPQVLRYLEAYFVEYAKYSAPTYGGFQYGYRDTIEYMESQRANYDLLLMTAVEVNQPQIFPLFYNHKDPRDPKVRHDIGYLIIDPAEYGRYNMNQRILAALRPTDLDLFSDYTIQKHIVAPGGREEFVIAEVRARKHFLTNWMVLGLFDNEGLKGINRDYIDVQHLSKNRVPGAFGEVYWRPITPQFVRVDLNRFFASSDPKHPGNPEYVCAYAAMTVRSPKAQSAFLELAGSDDMVRGWLNGRSLTPFPMMLDEKAKRRPIDLNAGDNLLMLQSCENVGSWYFAARITDEDGRDIPDLVPLQEIPEGPVPAPAKADADVQLIEGFDSIIAFKETSKSHPDYRGNSEAWWANVHHQPGEVVWRTAPVPQKKRTVLALTTSMSDEVGEAELFVNGTYAVTFSTGGDHGIRHWERGPYHLTFVSKAAVAGNSGIMLLDVPADQITPGQPVELRVIPARGAPEAWFMVKAYQDTIPHEHLTPQMAADALSGAWKSPPTAAEQAQAGGEK